MTLLAFLRPSPPASVRCPWSVLQGLLSEWTQWSLPPAHRVPHLWPSRQLSGEAECGPFVQRKQHSARFLSDFDTT